MDLVGGLFLVGLVLWWIIKSDLTQMEFQKRMREENAKRDAAAEADRREAYKIRRSSIAFAARRERHLKWCQDKCRSAQNAQGLVPIDTVGHILNWNPYTTWDGKTEYSFYGMVCGPGFEGNGECYANGSNADDENPFPSQAFEGFFRASDLIDWIERELRENRRYEESAGW
jgi:hypothetical protein